MIQKLTPLIAQNVLAFVQKTAQSYEHKLKTLVDQVGNLSTGYSVRKVKENDNHVVGALIRKVLLERGGIGLESLYYDRELNDIFTHYCSLGRSFNVLTYQKEIVGTAAFGINDSVNTICELKKFYILKEHRGKALGKVMLNTVLREAVVSGYDQCMLRVDQGNTNAIRFFEREGFKVSNDNSETTSVHEIVMVRSLDNI